MASLKYLSPADGNLMTVTLGSGYTAASGSMALTAGHGARLPSAGDFWIMTTSGTRRSFKVTARSTDTLTVTAAQDGTSDGNLDAGTELKWTLDVSAMEQLRADLMPTRATLWHQDSLVTVGNALTDLVENGHAYEFVWYQNAAADGDTFTQSFLLAAGANYTLKVFGAKYTSSGKVDWYIDDVSIGTGQDWYASGLTLNTTLTVGSITVTGSGRHTLKAVVNGKNASSSGYTLFFTKFAIVPSADAKSV